MITATLERGRLTRTVMPVRSTFELYGLNGRKGLSRATNCMDAASSGKSPRRAICTWSSWPVGLTSLT